VEELGTVGRHGAFPPPGFSKPRLVAAAALALVAGCAELEWFKAGAGVETRDRDLIECRDQARLRARQEAPLFGQPPPSPIGMDSSGRVVTGRAGRYDTERALMENDFTRACMKERGYGLTPAEKP
jgi:hypothetical protein